MRYNIDNMVKAIRSRTPDGKRISILVSDASNASYLNRKKGYSYLKLFSAVAINQTYKHVEEVSENKKFDSLRKILMGIDQHMTAILQFEKHASRKYEQILNRKVTRNVRNYTIEEQFLGYLIAMLNSLFSLKEFTGVIDKALGQSFAEKELWVDTTLENLVLIRHLLVHEGVPILTISRNKITLSFSTSSVKKSQAKKLLPKDYDTDSKYVDFQFLRPLVSHFIINAHMNTWAKRHLDAFNPDTKVMITTRVHKDGKVTQKPKRLCDLIKKANGAPLHKKS